MKIMVNKKGEGLKLRLSETFDIACIRDAKEKLGPILQMERDLVVDLSALTKMDTAGIQLLMLVKREANRKGFGCQFIHPASSIAAVLEMFHLPGLVVDPDANTQGSR